MCISGLLNAQKIQIVDGLVFEKYHHEYGLSDNTIISFIKDSQDFLWLGTTRGLNILDGNTVKLYKGYQNENNQFKGRFISSLFEDSNRNVFCGTRKYGLNIYDRSSGNFINIKNTLLKDVQSKEIRSIVELSHLNYAILTKKEIIFFRLDQNFKVTVTSIQNVDLIEKEYMRKLIVYNSQLYLNTNKRLLKVNDGKLELIYQDQWLKYCKVKNNKLWIMKDSSIGYFSKDLNEIQWIDYNLIKNPKHDIDYFLDFDVTTNNKEIWIGTKHQLIHLKLSDNNLVTSSKSYEFQSEVKSVTIDNLHNIYLATNNNQGLIKINGLQQQYNYIKLPEGFENVYQHILKEDNDGNYWIGSSNGIFHYNNATKSFRKFKNGSFKGIPGVHVTGLIKNSYGRMLFGTSNGIAIYDSLNNQFRFIGNANNEDGNNLSHHLQLDRDDILWYITKNNLNKIDPKTRKRKIFNMKDIDAIYIDNENTLWITSRGKGLEKYSIATGTPEFKKNYFISEEFLDYQSHEIINDKYGRLWIVGFNGIYVYDIKKESVVFHFNKNNLLENERLWGITPDNRGNFWINQYKHPGLCISSETFEVIETSPNWMRMESNHELFASPANVEDDGTISTEGMGGIFVYHLDSLTINEQPPKIVLQEVALNGKTIFNNFLGSNFLKFDKLGHRENNLELKLKAVNPETSYFTRYAYRLTGNSEEWQFTKELKSINFSGLIPNNYLVQVKSTNNGSTWSEPISLASFEVLPPWWQTNMAYVFYALLIASIIYSLYQFQIKKQLAETEAQKLKEVDEFKNTFYQNITHEFRTPLTVILGLTNQKKDDKSKIIERNASQLLNLVNELLEIGQVEANVSKRNISNQDIVKFIRYCTESLESLASTNKIIIEISTNKKEQFMDFDADKIQLVMNNLLSNAIKFTPEHGRINVVMEVDKADIQIHVKDTGPGIPENDLEMVFERYYQTNRKAEAKGTGIGLALSKEIIKLMDGSISASNNPDKGACLSIKLPIINTLSQELVANSSELNGEAYKDSEDIILVIEDNQDVLDYILSILKDHYQVHTAPNGKIGYEKAIELIPDLIISDVMMPIMDGFEACALIKSDFKTNHIPVILLTAKADLDSKLSGLKQGADVYLGKPFNRKELRTHIDNLIAIRENLKHKYSQQILEHQEEPKGHVDPFIDKLTQLILAKLSDSAFGIDQICRELAVSRTQLHRKLKALTGLSTSIFIRDIRLQEAFKMIKNTDLNVSEIAYSVGFNDPFYFSKLFSEKYEIPPSKIEK